MKYKLNLIIITVVALTIISGCNKSDNNNKTVNRSNVATVTNSDNGVNAATVATPDNRKNAPAVSKGNSKINVTNFDQIRNGMKYQDVVNILGSEGEIIGDSDMSGIKTVMYKWNGEVSGSFIKVIFQNDKLIDKAQTGLM